MRFPFAAAADAERTARRREGRARRYALRTRLRTSGIAGKRQALCGYAVHGGNDTGEVTLRRSAAGVASYGGLQTCELIWLCPVCSAAERSRRAAELEAAAKAHLAAGGGLVFGRRVARENALWPGTRRRRWRVRSCGLLRGPAVGSTPTCPATCLRTWLR